MTTQTPYIKFCAYLQNIYRVVPGRMQSQLIEQLPLTLDYTILCALVEMLDGPEIPYDCKDASAYYHAASVHVPGWYEMFFESKLTPPPHPPSTPLLIDVRCDSIFQFYEASVCVIK
jgi:hypothetical protein